MLSSTEVTRRENTRSFKDEHEVLDRTSSGKDTTEDQRVPFVDSNHKDVTLWEVSV